MTVFCKGENFMGKNTKKDILLTITMLVSNRPDTLEKCLSSMKPLLDGIPSELIIVDTAGNDECMEIAKRFTDRIFPFSWCNDFAAARNTGLCKAKGQWVMYIDDDEWFEDVSDLTRFFSGGEYKKYQTASYITRNYSDKTGKGYNDRMAVRLSKRYPDTKFVGRIHEQIEPLYEPTYYSTAYVHHYGYAFESKEDLYQHSWRNIKLLTEAMVQEKDNMMAGAHLIQEYSAVSEFFSLIAVAKELRSSDRRFEYGRIDFTVYAIVMEMKAYLELKRYQEAYALGTEMLKESRLILNAYLFILAMLPQVCLKCSNCEEALKYSKMFWEYLKQWHENEQQCKARDPFSLRDKFLNEDNFGFLHMIEMHCYIQDKDWEAARKAFLDIKWIFAQSLLSDTFRDILILISNTEYHETYSDALNILLKGKGTQQFLIDHIEKLEGEEKWRVMYCLSQISTTDIQIMKYKMQFVLSNRDVHTLNSLLDQWKNLSYSLFFPDKEYWKGLRKMRIDLSPWLSDVSIHEWITLTEALFDQFPAEDCENVFKVLSKGLPQTDIRMMHLMGLQLEKRLLTRNMKLENPDYLGMEDIWKEVYRIASLWVSCAAMLYQESVFQGELQSALPGRYRFAWLIFQANAVKGDTLSFIKKVGEAAKAYLGMSDVCKYILRCCKVEADEQEISQVVPEK